MKRWEDKIREKTGLEWNIILRKAENLEEWKKLAVKYLIVPRRSARQQGRGRGRGRYQRLPHFHLSHLSVAKWMGVHRESGRQGDRPPFPRSGHTSAMVKLVASNWYSSG